MNTIALCLLALGPIIDDGDAGYVDDANWYSTSGGYGGDHRYHTGAGTTNAEYNFNITPGVHEVYITWPSNGSGDTTGTIYIYDGGDIVETVSVDFTTTPDGETVEGVPWRWLVTREFTSATLKVEVLRSEYAGYALADAVRIESVASEDDAALAEIRDTLLELQASWEWAASAVLLMLGWGLGFMLTRLIFLFKNQRDFW